MTALPQLPVLSDLSPGQSIVLGDAN